jgi:DNA-directed RNA polymerase specialized sigma24 family protein
MSSVTRPTRTPKGGARHLLEDYGRDRQRGRALRAKLANSFPDRPEEEIEDAVQSACQLFLAEAPGITEPGRAFVWLRTAAYRALLRELDTQRRALLADPSGPMLDTEELDAPGPGAELIGLEEESDLKFLVDQISSNLSESRLQVFALWATGRKRPEIAEELGMSERAVKKALEQIMHNARETLARQAGGGCEDGQPVVMRMACGLAEAGETARARLHIQHCDRCSEFSEALEGWREKAAPLLAPVTAEAASPGLVGRTVGRVGEAIGSAKRHVLSGGTQVKQQATLVGYGRTPDPTPLAGIRPGAVTAVVVGCLAIGGGAATYCAQQGVDPIGAAKDLIAGAPEESAGEPSEPKPEEPAVSPEQSSEAPVEEPVVVPSYEPAEEEQPPASSSTAAEEPPSKKSESESTDSSETAMAEPEETVTEEAPPPPPEQSFEAASPDYPAVESSSSSSQSSSSSSSESSTAGAEEPKPAAVPKNEAPQFGGP